MPDRKPPLVYHVSPLRRWVLTYVLLLFALLALGLAIGGSDDESRTAGIVVLAVVGTFLAFWEWLMRRTRLVLTAAEIRLEQVGMRLVAPWSDVEAFYLARGREGFAVRRPLAGKGAARFAAVSELDISATPQYTSEQLALVAQHRWIPIEAFAWHARRGALASDVARLAPRVRVIVEERAPLGPEDRRSIVVIVAIVLVALAAGIALAMGAFGAAGNWIIPILQSIAAPLLAIGTAARVPRAWRSRSWLMAGCSRR